MSSICGPALDGCQAIYVVVVFGSITVAGIYAFVGIAILIPKIREWISFMRIRRSN